MNSYIFLVGKGDPQGTSIQAIRRAGYRVGLFLDSLKSVKNPDDYDRIITMDFANLDTSIDDIERDDITIEGLLCTYENYIVAKAKLAKKLALPSLSVAAAEASTDKNLMRSAFTSFDPSISPQFRLIQSESELLDFARTATFPLILKPTNLVKSLLVMKCNDEKELVDNYRYALRTIGPLYEKYGVLNRDPQLIVEEFIEGDLYSVAAFVDDRGDAHFCDGVVALTNAHDRGVDDNYLYRRELPASLLPEILSQLFEVAKKGIQALGLTSTAAHVELIHGPNGTKLVEIGARIGGYRPRMYQYSYGIDMVGQEIAAALAAPLNTTGAFHGYSAVYELFPNQEGYFEKIENADDVDRFAYFRVKPHVGQKIGPAKNGHKAAAIIMVTETDRNRFEESCRLIDAMKVVVS